MVCDLTTGYACSSDGLVWTFILRDDAVFSDVEPLTASDVAFTVNGVIASAGSEADLSMVETAVAVSDTVVELHLKRCSVCVSASKTPGSTVSLTSCRAGNSCASASSVR